MSAQGDAFVPSILTLTYSHFVLDALETHERNL